MTDPLIGKEIGGCRIQQMLGQGGMGVVYKAHHIGLDRTVVVKFLSAQAVAIPGLVEGFLREAQAAAKLEHPRTVQVYDRGSMGNLHYIIMQFVDGETLEEKIERDGPLSPLKAVSVLKAALEGLAEAHKFGIVHRDIKPSNILLGKDGSIRLSDFGLAVKVQPGSTGAEQGVTGTPHYMSPEQVWGAAVDGRCDIYSMGATFFHMLAGHPPFHAETARDLMAMHVNEATPDIRTINPEASKMAAEVIAKMMAKKPEERYADVQQVLDALNSPAMVLDVGTVEGEMMIDLGVTPRRPPPKPAPRAAPPQPAPPGPGQPAPVPPEQSPPPQSPPVPEPGGGISLPVDEIEPPPASDDAPSRFSAVRTPGALGLLAVGAGLFMAAGSGRNLVPAGMGAALSIAAVLLRPSGAGLVSLLSLAAADMLFYLSGLEPTGAPHSVTTRALFLPAGAFCGALSLALAEEMPRYRILAGGYLAFALAMAAAVFLFALPPDLAPAALKDSATRPVQALTLGGVSLAAILFTLIVYSSEVRTIGCAFFLLLGAAGAYGSGALHLNPRKASPAPAPAPARPKAPKPKPAQKLPPNVLSQLDDGLCLVLEEGQTVVKDCEEVIAAHKGVAEEEPKEEPAAEEPQAADPAPDAAPPALTMKTLTRPITYLAPEIRGQAKLKPLAAAFLLLGLFAFWRGTRTSVRL